ncbi:pimeloyl-ACP methyl ester carboxylesterase [Janthinobacterium sp. CG_23.3]|uniref:alpha/beta fold hydrolase n=1 Tax=Janthinobacterium sp. CG_23.3 TaxID=3349634 RepID=UPI0038D4C6C3
MTYRLNLPAILLALACAVPLAQAVPAAQKGRSCHLPGSEEALRCVSVAVPLDYARPGAGTIALHVTLAPALRDPASADPLFVLAGGPGEAGSDVLPLLTATFRKTRATRDIVFIDQRGSGRSGKLECDSPDDDDEALGDAAAERAALACLRALKQPLAAYTTAAAARDLERVRLALGYAKVNLWGGSYGTRLGQVYARAFPASVRALILDGVAAPEQVIPAGGRDSQAALDGLFKRCAANPGCAAAYPNLRAEFAGLLERVGRGAIELDLTNPRTAEPLRVTMSSRRFLGTVHGILYSPLDSGRLPFLIHGAHQGRWQPFVARSNVATDFSTDAGPGLGLYLAVTCAEDFPRLTPQLLADDTRGSFMNAAEILRLSSLCQAIRVPAQPYVAPARIAAPVLMLSGALDPVTPPHRAEAAGRHMRDVQHFVVANAGHGVSQLGCAPRLLRAFLDQPGRPLAAECLGEIPAPPFLLRSAGPQP